uniref:HNH endonuclease n=1 Tax=Shewanella chilikensis TaxID=558541 RepID=UPI001E42BDBE
GCSHRSVIFNVTQNFEHPRFISYLESSAENSNETSTPLRPIPQAEPDKKTMQEIWARRGQAKFRENLLAAYENTCAVTGCIESEVLEAAHIVPYSEEQSYELSNGILLRADIHTLFDLFLISIDPQTGNVVVANRLSEEYQQFSGRKASLPSNPDLLPNTEALMAHKRRTVLQ